MSDRRTWLLVALVAVAAIGVLLVDAPIVPLPREQVTGPRVVKVRAADVSALEIALADGAVRLERAGAGWTADGTAAGERLVAAIDDLVGVLTELRAIDRFRDARDAPFELDRPFGRVVVETPRRTVPLSLGAFNAARSAVYARLDGRPRVLLLGAYLLAAMDRVFYYFHLERDGGPPAQRPEIG